MSQSTFIYPEDAEELTLEKIISIFEYYQQITTKTGEQLDWDYQHYSFPYLMEMRKDTENGEYLFLKGTIDRYKTILIGVNEKEDNPYIQITLPDHSTHGDKGKANEFAKFLAKKLNGRIRLFSGRLMG